MKTQSLSLLAAAGTLLHTTTASPRPQLHKYHLNGKPATTPSDVQFTLPSPGLLDNPKVLQVNSTTFDWWYFDAVSSDLPSGDLSSVSLVFYNANNGGLAFLGQRPSDLLVQLGGSFANGTPIVPTYTLSKYVKSATVEAGGGGSIGKFGEYGGWEGGWDGVWEARFDDDKAGIHGSLKLEAVAPPTLPCSPPKAGGNEIFMPGVGWASAVPDAKATVDFDVAGEKLQFTGVGYHDKNWGDRPFLQESVSSWYWGHAHLGPYSLVWFDALSQPATDPTEYFTAYVAKGGKIITASCSDGVVTARPWGGEDRYPPPPNKKFPAGYEVVFADVEGKELRVNVTVADVVLPALTVYDRFIGSVEGGPPGDEKRWTGVSVFEQFKI